MKRIVNLRLALIFAILGSLPTFAAAQSDATLPAQVQTATQQQPVVLTDTRTDAGAPDSTITDATVNDATVNDATVTDIAVAGTSAVADATAAGDPADQGESPSSQAASSVNTGHGSDTDENAINRHLLSTFFRDEYHIWTGPFHASNYDSHTMKKYGIPFLIISGASIATDRYTAKWLPNTKDQILWSGRVSQIGAPYTLAGFAAGTLLVGHLFHNDHAQESGLLALEALAHSGIMVEVLKEVTQRARPIDTTHGTGWWQGGVSFPSGHAISSFAVATVFAYEYHDHIIVPITAYSLASIVALSRMGAREHWISDLFVGGTMGFMMGRYVYKQHHDPELPGSLPVRRSIVARLKPDFGVGSAGPGFYWNF